VGIALPRFLLQKENHIPVLLAAFFLLLVVIPAYVYINYGGTVHLDDNGIHVSNR
jgi:preprotein translocase subunit Sec63